MRIVAILFNHLFLDHLKKSLRFFHGENFAECSTHGRLLDQQHGLLNHWPNMHMREPRV